MAVSLKERLLTLQARYGVAKKCFLFLLLFHILPLSFASLRLCVFARVIGLFSRPFVTLTQAAKIAEKRHNS
jgi:hypothetical protein